MTDTGNLGGAIAVTRFGLGAQPGEIDQAAGDPKAWLRSQIRRSGADQPAAGLPTSRDRLLTLISYRDQVKTLKMDAGTDPSRHQRRGPANVGDWIAGSKGRRWL